MGHRSALLGLLCVLLVPQLGCEPRDMGPVEEHVLNRLGYGPDAWSRERIRAGRPAKRWQAEVTPYIEEQLHPELLDDSALEAHIWSRFPALRKPYSDLRFDYHVYNPPGPADVRRQMVSAKLLRAIYSKKQLEQVLVDFWFNHFNVDSRRDVARWATLPYERDAIRPHVLGRFEDLLRATAGHTAMLNYLDNAANFYDGFIRESSFPKGINENYARELLELHTLGVDAPYTLDDIQNVARAFTGWTIYGLLQLQRGMDGSLYLDEGHDKGAKTIMGELYIPPGGGQDDGEAVIVYLARHPLTAERVARKLCVRFVSETPSEELVSYVRDVFLLTDGDLRQVMRAILTSREFLRGPFRTKVKRPFTYVASLARAVGVADEASFLAYAIEELEKMGEPPYQAAPPTGFPETSSAWVAHGTFLRRVNYAYRAGGGAQGYALLPGLDGSSAELVDQLTDRLIFGGISSASRTAAIGIANGLSGSVRQRETAAALLASPEFLTH